MNKDATLIIHTFSHLLSRLGGAVGVIRLFIDSDQKGVWGKGSSADFF